MGKFTHHSRFTKAQKAGTYLFPHVCFGCRKSFKKTKTLEPRRCPQCSQAMVRLSRKFYAPKTGDTEQWSKVQFLVLHGFYFHSVYAPSEGGGKQKVAYPARLSDCAAFVTAFRDQAIRPKE